MKAPSQQLLVIISALALMHTDLPVHAQLHSSPVGSAPSLATYGIDIGQTSVSGVSSGGAMAVQMHVAHSSIMRGVGVIAGVAYGCADPSLPFALRVDRLLNCMDGIPLFGGSAGAD